MRQIFCLIEMILHKKYSKQTMLLALPVMLTQMGQASVQLIDNIIVGRLLGANALAAVSLGNALFFAVFIFGLGISFAIPPLVSEAHSQKNDDKINSVFRHGFVLNISIGLALMLLLLALKPMLWHLDQPEEILPDTAAFLTIMAYSIIPFMAFQTMREVSEGLGFTIGVTISTILANIVNVALNYILIKGMYGFPAMGVQGSALATLIARIFMLICLYIVMVNYPLTKKYIKAFSLKISNFKKKTFTHMLSLGLPTALQMFFEVTAFAGAAFICGKASTQDLASHQIALSMASFTFNLCIGFSVASTVMVGRKMGEKDFLGMRAIGINNIKLTFLFMAICGIIFIVGRDFLAASFTKEEDIAVIQLASQLLIIAALFQLSDGIQVTSLGTLRGMQDVKIPSVITFIAYWLITIPLGYILCIEMEMGAWGMWIALGIGLTISAVLLVIRFLKLSSKRIGVK